MRIASGSIDRQLFPNRLPGGGAPVIPAQAPVPEPAPPETRRRPRLVLMPSVPVHDAGATTGAPLENSNDWPRAVQQLASLAPELLVELFWLRALDDPRDDGTDPAASHLALVRQLLATGSESGIDRALVTTNAARGGSAPRLTLLPRV